MARPIAITVAGLTTDTPSDDEVLARESGATVWKKVGNAMVADTAAIEGKKLKPVRIATTVAGLPGSAEDGALAMLRVGSSPYDFVWLIYDSTLGKWVSNVYAMEASGTAGETTTSTTYTPVGIGRLYISDYKNLYDAGLRAYAKTTILMWNDNGGESCSTRFRVFDAADGETAFAAFATGATDPLLTVTTTTPTLKSSNWDLLSGAPSASGGLITLEKKVSGGTGNFHQVAILIRWQSS